MATNDIIIFIAIVLSMKYLTKVLGLTNSIEESSSSPQLYVEAFTITDSMVLTSPIS